MGIHIVVHLPGRWHSQSPVSRARARRHAGQLHLQDDQNKHGKQDFIFVVNRRDRGVGFYG